jgi:hypothetical protein
MKKRKIIKTPPELVAKVARRTESLKAAGARRVLVVYDEDSARLYEDRAEGGIPPPRESA